MLKLPYIKLMLPNLCKPESYYVQSCLPWSIFSYVWLGLILREDFRCTYNYLYMKWEYSTDVLSIDIVWDSEWHFSIWKLTVVLYSMMHNTRLRGSCFCSVFFVLLLFVCLYYLGAFQSDLCSYAIQSVFCFFYKLREVIIATCTLSDKYPVLLFVNFIYYLH